MISVLLLACSILVTNFANAAPLQDLSDKPPCKSQTHQKLGADIKLALDKGLGVGVIAVDCHDESIVLEGLVKNATQHDAVTAISMKMLPAELRKPVIREGIQKPALQARVRIYSDTKCPEPKPSWAKQDTVQTARADCALLDKNYNDFVKKGFPAVTVAEMSKFKDLLGKAAEKARASGKKEAPLALPPENENDPMVAMVKRATEEVNAQRLERESYFELVRLYMGSLGRKAQIEYSAR